MEEMILKPIGTIRSRIKDPILAADAKDISLQCDMKEAREQVKELPGLVSEIVLHPGFEDLLDGIEDFSHLLVLYWAHRVPAEARSLLKVHPMGREDFPLKGIFATCSPARPNPILVNAVRLLRRKGNVLEVQGLEAIDGSPLVDIKPYLPFYYGAEGVRLPDWMLRAMQEIEGAEAPRGALKKS